METPVALKESHFDIRNRTRSLVERYFGNQENFLVPKFPSDIQKEIEARGAKISRESFRNALKWLVVENRMPFWVGSREYGAGGNIKKLYYLKHNSNSPTK